MKYSLYILSLFLCPFASIGQNKLESAGTEQVQRPASSEEISLVSNKLALSKPLARLSFSPIEEPNDVVNFNSFLQSKNSGVESPYQTSLLKDGLALGGAVGLTLLGYTLIRNKDNLTMDQLAAKSKDNLLFIDKGVAGNYSYKVDKDSYILFNGSYALPVVAALIDSKMRSKFGQLMVLYVETVGITGAMYTLTAGLVYRSRPFVYGDKAPLDKRLDKGGQRSFYGGHVATTAAITFFVSKIYQDFHPDSKLTPYLYGTSVALTGLMGYMRAKAGYHFVSDCILSGIIGAATGVLIPHWHKTKASEKLSFSPAIMQGSSGLQLTYKF